MLWPLYPQETRINNFLCRLSGTANLSLRGRIIDEGFFGVNYLLGDDIGVAVMVFVYKY